MSTSDKFKLRETPKFVDNINMALCAASTEGRTKVCLKCNINKTLYEFEFRKDTKKIRNECKQCKSEYHKTWKSENTEKVNEWNTLYREKKREHLTKYHKTWRYRNIERINERRKIVYKRNMENPEFRILQSCRSRINNIVITKTNRTIKLMGCSSNFLRAWLEFQFTSSMSWENYGAYWHIEHVFPCASFDLTSKDEQYKCFNWTNLKPLEAIRNCSKGKKVINIDLLRQEIAVHYYQRYKL